MAAWFSQASLNTGVRRREVFGWAMYDFANSGYTTVVLTAVFNAYFVGAVAGGADWATLAWTAALGASRAICMLTMPTIDLRLRLGLMVASLSRQKATDATAMPATDDCLGRRSVAAAATASAATRPRLV